MKLSEETKAKLEEFFKTEFYDVYCNTCKNEGNEDKCDYCNRKAMYWSISNETVQRIINTISEELEEQEDKLEDEQ